MSGFRDYQSVIQVGVRRGDATRRVPLDPEEVRALFGIAGPGGRALIICHGFVIGPDAESPSRRISERA